MDVLALSGSLRRDSYNTGLLRTAARLAPAHVSLELFDRLGDVPPYDGDVESLETPPAVAELKRRIADADAVLIATPEYNGSIPGHLKNALDWVSRPMNENPFRGTPTAVIGASTGSYGGIWAQAELRKVLGILGARLVEGELAVPDARAQFDVAGQLVNEDLRGRLRQLLVDLVGAAVPVVT